MNNTVEYLEPYTAPGALDAIFDYPTYHALRDAFATPSGNLSALMDVVTQAQKAYEGGLFLTASFLENHDTPRFANTTSDLAVSCSGSVTEQATLTRLWLSWS